MRKKYFKYLYMFLIIFLITSGFTFNNNVLATYEITTNFDDVATGLSNFTSGNFICNISSGSEFETSNDYDLSSPNSLFIGDSSEGYANLTYNIDYIGVINFSAVFGNGASDSITIKFFDGSHEVIRIMVNNDENFYWYSQSGAQNLDDLDPGTRYYIRFEHTGTNQFRIQIMDSSFNVLDDSNHSCYYAGDYYNFNSIFFDSTTTSNTYIDDIILSDDATAGCGDIGNYDSFCTGSYGVYGTTEVDSVFIESKCLDKFTGVIYAVDLAISQDQYNLYSIPSGYDLVINGEHIGNANCIFPFGTGYAVRWIDEYNGLVTLDDDYPIFSFMADFPGNGYKHWLGIGINPSSGNSLSSEHNNYFNYLNNQFEGTTLPGGKISLCYYYDANISDYQDDVDSDLENYTSIFGNEFIEFYNFNQDCFHRVNDNPYIIYNLSDDNYSTDEYYSFDIIKSNGNKSVYFGKIKIIGDYNYKKLVITDFKFIEEGQYYIRLYNTTNYGGNIDSIVYTSQPIYVCEDDTVSPWTPPSQGGEWYGLPFFVPYLIGIFITLIITMSPLIIATYITRKTSYKKIDIPALLYVGFFFMGLIVSVVTGFLPVWLPFVILFAMIMYFAIQWLYGKKETVSGE